MRLLHQAAVFILASMLLTPAYSAGGEEAPSDTKPTQCTEAIQDALMLEHWKRCRIRLLRYRCTDVDACLIDCYLTNKEAGVAQACRYECRPTVGATLYQPPPGFVQCPPPPPPPPRRARSSGRGLRVNPPGQLGANILQLPLDDWEARLQSDDPEERRNLIEALPGSAPPGQFLPALAGVLQDPDESMQLAAAEALARISRRTTAATLSLVDALACTSAQARITAVRALAWPIREDTAPQGTLQTILHLAEEDKTLVREAVVLALREVDAPEVCPALVARLEDDETVVRRAAIEILAANCKDSHGMAAAKLIADTDPSTSHQAILLLAEIDWRPGETLTQLAHVLESGEPRFQYYAVQRIRTSGEYFRERDHPDTAATDAAQALALLLPLLEDSRPGLREMAVEAIRALGHHALSAVPQLAALAVSEEKMSPRVAAIDSLAFIGPDPHGVSAGTLLAALRGSSAAAVAAAAGLRRFGEDYLPRIEPALKEAFGQGEAPGQVVLGLQLLGASYVDAVIPLLARLAVEGPEPGIRRDALQQLEKAGLPAASATPALVQALGDDYPEVRLQAIATLSAVNAKGVDAIDALRAALQEGNEKVALAAAKVLREVERNTLLGAGHDMTQLTQILREGSDHERQIAALALGAFGADAEAVLPQLIAALVDESPAVRKEVRKVLEGLGPAAVSALPTLVASMVLEESMPERLEARRALVRIGSDSSIFPDDLSGLMDHDDWQIRWLAVTAAGQIGVREAAPMLLKGIQDGDERVQFESALGLVVVGQAEHALDLLVAVFNDLEPERFAVLEDPQWLAGQIRNRLLRHLQSVPPETPGATQVYLRLLRHAEPSTRRLALDFLGKVELLDPVVVPQLTELLRDPDEKIQGMAAHLLVLASPEDLGEVVPYLIGNLRAADPAVRIAAIQALARLDSPTNEVREAMWLNLADYRRFVRLAGLEAMCRLIPRTKESVQRLVRAILDKRTLSAPNVVAAALWEIGPVARTAIPDKRTLPSLDAVAAAFWEMGPVATTAIPDFLDALNERSRPVGSIASRMLRGIGPEAASAVPILVVALVDPSVSVRGEALMALGAIGPSAAPFVEQITVGVLTLERSMQGLEAVPWKLGPEAAPHALRILFSHPMGQRNSRASIVLQAMGPAAVTLIPELIQALDDWDVGVRQVAAQALGGIGPEAGEALPSLRRKLADPNAGVRHAAVDAIAAISGVGGSIEPVVVVGSVADLAGHPRAGVAVRKPRSSATDVLTDAQGRFRLMRRPETWLQLRAELGDKAESMVHDVSIPEGAMAVEFFRLEPKTPGLRADQQRELSRRGSFKKDIQCEIRGKTRYQVGDTPDLEVLITHQGRYPFPLPRATGCSASPRASVSILAPVGSLDAADLPLCPPWRDIRHQDLVELSRGGTFKPLRDTPPAFRLHFPRPGAYKFTFRYQWTPDSNLGMKWPEDETLFEKLMLIPKVNTSCSIRVWVAP